MSVGQSGLSISHHMQLCLALLAAAYCPHALASGRVGRSRAITLREATGEKPITRVVHLLEEMKAQVEAEAKEDEKLYGKMKCWCKTNEREKTAAVEKAKTQIEDLSAAIDEGTAKAAGLASKIDALKKEMKENQESVDEATAIREKERGEFESEEKDSMETLAALKEAIPVLEKVQLVQKQAGSHENVNAMLLQVRSLLGQLGHTQYGRPTGRSVRYTSVMQKDLWDLVSALPGKDTSSSRVVTGLEQQPTGAAAGATSYSARSSTILGMLKAMQDNFSKDLAEAHTEEITAEVGFQRLRAAKDGEIQAAAKAVEERSMELADTNDKVAKAKEDLEDTKEALAADQQFMVEMEKQCTAADKEYDVRMKTRQEEIAAIAEAIKILMEDDFRDLVSNQISFVQTGSSQRSGSFRLSSVLSAQQQRKQAAASLMMMSQRMSGTSAGWRLATLAVGVQVDGLEKVKQMMDKMIVQLKKQQKEEYEKKEDCTQSLKENTDDTMVKESDKRDFEAQIAALDGAEKKLAQELEDLKEQISEVHIAMKTASDKRKDENQEFQQIVADQREMVTILKKALDKLREFYDKPKSFLAAGRSVRRQEPGAPVEPPPPAGKEYEKSGMAPGVIQTLEKIIQDAEKADHEAVQAEQESQDAYVDLVTSMNSELDAMETATTDKKIAKDKAAADKIEASKDLKATERMLEKLVDENKALHMDCDYVMKNFDIRQTARQQEIEAVQEAKAILSGA